MTRPRRQPLQLERITTGSDRLDRILAGGIPRYSVVFVAGLPGTGKTILSEQALFANARLGRTGLYLSTISEPPIKVLRFLQEMTFFDPGLFGSKVIYGDLGGPLRTEGPAGLVSRLDQLVRDNRPEVVVIDSFKALRDAIPDPLAFREFTSDLAIRLSAWEVTSLLLGEYSAEDVREGPEFAIADGIIYLYGTEEAEKQKRFLRVMKMRGTSYYSGEHYFRIGVDGITVYPRMLAEAVGAYAVPGNRIGSAVEGLSAMLGGGLFASTSTLLSGPTGTGKSLVALSFLVDAARSGQPGLLVSFEESPDQLIRNSAPFGWELDRLIQRKLLDIFHVSPSELNVDQHAFDIQDRVEKLGAKLVVIDSISAFEAAVPNLAKYQSFLWAITDYFKRKGVSVILTAEGRGPFEALEISARNISFLSDNIIFLRYVEIGAEIKRVIGVLKTRGSHHDRALRELVIDPPRLAVGAPLTQVGMLGTTVRERGSPDPVEAGDG